MYVRPTSVNTLFTIQPGSPGPEAASPVAWLQANHHPVSLVGGKGASLGRLFALGAPVPPAFALTTGAYSAFAVAHGLPQRAVDLELSDLDSVRAEIMAASMPATLIEAIAGAFQDLVQASTGELSVAVRSSGTVEDSAQYSFAGLHDTVLDVRDMPGLETAIRTCWASLWSARAVEYRHACGLAADVSSIAVVIQRLVRSDVSFVSFSADPVTGSPERVVIDATWGLGEAIVSGLVAPDHVTVGKDGDVRSYHLGGKHQMVIPGDRAGDGVRTVPVPRLLQATPALSSGQARQIAAMTRDLSRRLGYEVDIEGAIAGNEIYLFQARPITTLGR